ncbi:MAG: hypothetical protein KA144_05940 [Xanthomonadaceae bacterium]|nr:hypothetical protein [Xanthomonadaceae bacterium]
MIFRRNSPDIKTLKSNAYAAFERGELAAAREAFDTLLERVPDDVNYRYMQGLVCKYLRNWPQSLAHNRRSIELRDERDDASLWNAAIAATALGEWAEARRLWATCGIVVPEGEGPIEADFGIASVRLNPWGRAETLYARRIDPVRARLLNIPLPESGYRRGDIVLHDGAGTGKRPLGDGWVPVFNVLQRCETSEFRTFAAFVDCPSRADLEALLTMRVPGIDDLEDWTGDVVYYCLRCSYGAPHRHREPDEIDGWDNERNLGIAAQSRHSVDKLLREWAAKAPGRRIDAVEACAAEPSVPSDDAGQWWDTPSDENDETSPDDGSRSEH